MRRNGPYCNKQSLILAHIDSRARIHTRHLLITSKSTQSSLLLLQLQWFLRFFSPNTNSVFYWSQSHIWQLEKNMIDGSDTFGWLLWRWVGIKTLSAVFIKDFIYWNIIFCHRHWFTNLFSKSQSNRVRLSTGMFHTSFKIGIIISFPSSQSVAFFVKPKAWHEDKVKTSCRKMK